MVGGIHPKSSDTDDQKPQIICTYLQKVMLRMQKHIPAFSYTVHHMFSAYLPMVKTQKVSRNCLLDFMIAMSCELAEDNDDFDGISDQIRCKVNLIGEGEGREGRNIDQSYLLSFSPIIMPGPI